MLEDHKSLILTVAVCYFVHFCNPTPANLNSTITFAKNASNPRNSSAVPGSAIRKFEPEETTPAPTVNEIWGGNCTDIHWKKCSDLKTYFSYYVDKKDPDKKVQHHEIDCKIQPAICLKNGWTVTRCQMLCMGRCNKALMSKYDDYVEREGQC